MDINNMDDHNDDETIGSIDDVGSEVEPVDNSDGTPENPKFSAPLLRDPVTGKFIKGTGTRGHLGGRPKGAKDKISTKMIEICSDLVANKGAEILEHLARTDPAAAMAICLKVVPNSEWMQAHSEERSSGQSGPQEVTIRMVSSPSQRLPDDRTQAQIRDQQRGLNSPVERLPEPSGDDLRDVIEAEIDAPTEPVESDQERADREAAEAERERIQRQNDAIRAHGGLTGKPARSARPDTLDYPEDGLI